MQCAAEDPRDLTVRAEVIRLGSETKIRIRKGGYLIGYFSTPEEADQALRTQGLSLADIEVSE